MHDPEQELPLVAELDAEGQTVSWTEADGTPVRVINGRSPLRTADAVPGLCRQIRRQVAPVER